jgi:acetoin utilization protein AcuB
MTQIRYLMTPSPQSVGAEQPVAEAARRMRAHHIRHLPVLRGGKLEGIVSERDIALVLALPLDPDKLTVEEAMSPAPYAVSPDTDIAEVVKRMGEEKLGSVVVVDGDKVVGIVTTTDCLALLWERLSKVEKPDLAPSAVRQRILGEHVALTQMMDRLESLAAKVNDGDRDAVGELRAGVRGLYERLRRHIDLEDRILAPALRETPGFGELREQQLLSHHDEQRKSIETHLGALDAIKGPALAAQILEFIAEVRADMKHEDEDYLKPELLKDDLIQVEFAG